MKIAFIYNKHKLSGKLTKLFTGSYCYHVAFVDEDAKLMFDMNLLRRVRHWPHYPADHVVLVDTPVPVTTTFLNNKLLTDESTYGWMDYTLFALRPLFHLFGKSTYNAGGIICSEMVYSDLVECGWDVRFDEVPSPADLEHALLKKE